MIDRIKKWTIALVLLFGVAHASALDPVDSVQIYLDSAASLLRSNPQQVENLSTRAIDLLSPQDSKTTANAHFLRGSSHRLMGNLKSAESDLLHALKHCPKNDTLIADIYNGLGVIFKQRSQFEDALAHYQKAMDIYRDNAKPLGVARTMNNIGRIHFAREDYSSARDYYNKCLKIYRQKGVVRSLGITYQNIGAVFEKQIQPDSALHYYQLALPLYSRSGDKVLLAYGHAALSSVEKDAKSAMEHLRRSIIVREELGLEADMEESYEKLGVLFLREGNTEEALKWFHMALDQSYKTGHSIKTRDLLEQIYQTYASQGDHKNALKYHEDLLLYEDSVRSSENEAAIMEFQARFRHAQQEKEIEILKKDNHIRDIELEKTNLQLRTREREKDNLLLGSVIVLCLLVIVVFLVIKQRRANQILKSQKDRIEKSHNEKEMLVREIHHRVKNNLQIITSLLRTEQRKLKKGEAYDVLQESKLRIELISEIHEKLYQQEDLADINLEEFLKDIGESILASFNKGSIISLEINSSLNEECHADQAINLGQITAELITNSIKHGFFREKPGTLSVQLTKQADTLRYTYMDNGSGLSAGQSLNESDSFGFKLIRSLIKKSNGKVIEFNGDSGFKLIFDFI